MKTINRPCSTIYETNDYSIFNILPENRCSESDLDIAIELGFNEDSHKRFKTRLKGNEINIEKNGFSELITLPTWQDADGKLYLGDGATRISVLKKLKEEGKKDLPLVQYKVISYTQKSRKEFVKEMRKINGYNGFKWDVSDKIIFSARDNSETAKKIIELRKKYGFAIFLISDTVFNTQGTSKQNFDLEKNLISGKCWKYADDFCNFISKLYHNIDDVIIKKKVLSEKSFTILRQLYSLIANECTDANRNEQLCLLKDVLSKELAELNYDAFKNTKLTEWWEMYLTILKNYVKKRNKRNFTDEIKNVIFDTYCNKISTKKLTR